MSTHGCCADESCTAETCMALPEGKTCGDCAHFSRCEALGTARAAGTSCDWFPRRFRERKLFYVVMENVRDEPERYLVELNDSSEKVVWSEDQEAAAKLSQEVAEWLADAVRADAVPIDGIGEWLSVHGREARRRRRDAKIGEWLSAHGAER